MSKEGLKDELELATLCGVKCGEGVEVNLILFNSEVFIDI